MKTNKVTTHDYITVSVRTADKARANFTVSFSGAKASSSSVPGTAGSADLSTSWKTHMKTINLFLRGMPNNHCAPLEWINFVELAGNAASDFNDFFTRLNVMLDTKIRSVTKVAA